MSLSAPTKITVPWASSGTYTTIPAAADNVQGRAGWDLGFPPINLTAKEAGGIPPFGQDMNGLGNAVSSALRWLEGVAGAYPYDSAFATAVGGYPAGALVWRTDGSGYWRNTVTANTTDPEAFGAGWQPEQAGLSSIAMSNTNVTLTALQAGRAIILITGTLTANLNLIFPGWTQQWLVVNSASGAYSVTCKTAAGSGVAVATGATAQVYGDGTNIALSQANYTPIQSVSAVPSANTLVCGYVGGTLQFRSATLSNGVPTTLAIGPLSLTIPSGASLGSVSAVQSQFVYAVLYNGGSPVLAVANISGGIDMSETGLISSTAISSSATSNAVWYSSSAVTSSPYRIVGVTQQTEATAGVYATAPSLVQGVGGEAFSALMSAGYGQTWTNVTASRAVGTTYYNTKNRPIVVWVTAANNISGGTTSMSATINGVTGYLASIYFGTTGAQFGSQCTVPVGGSYSVALGAATLSIWNELS
jgi:hypothetical protein